MFQPSATGKECRRARSNGRRGPGNDEPGRQLRFELRPRSQLAGDLGRMGDALVRKRE